MSAVCPTPLFLVFNVIIPPLLAALASLFFSTNAIPTPCKFLFSRVVWVPPETPAP